ncbi:Aminoglycoside phosphotransferase [Penicillium samsonianum]|uniref:Aminoglycoside phosphotransferase n=1 Tax=Penicillium samsonianum TaxID=1882272 RepID=UPI002548DB1C|nr:Aminoglycoside phosphotransferase [Penicillium samsonianum]KAJ6143525.1 Aminoglycoside phosphotransferase [Penicillium samsonianum]
MSRLGRRHFISHSPELYAETQNGQGEKIPEEDLHRYTRHRWLFNEEKELSERYVEFDLEQLVQVAVSVCEGAQSYTRVTKCAEGLHNKAFILTMDNGCEVFAKLPNPNAGPARFTIASEIATRKLLSDVLKLPVPRVLAWSFDAASNPVGAEYIIEEKAPGVRLGSVWNQWPRQSKLQLITQVIDIQNNLADVTFDMHGCIYFKDDLRSLGEEPKEVNIQSATTSVPDTFAIGPLTTGELWNGEHPDDGLALLTNYMKVPPYLIPRSTNEAVSNEAVSNEAVSNEAVSNNVLMHPDLHLDNIFVDPETLQITRIDVYPPWASQEGWAVPDLPEDFDNLSTEEQRKIDDDLESQILHKYYEAQVYKRSPHYWSVFQDSRNPIIRKPVWLVKGVWEHRNLFFLRQSLMSLFAHWEELFPDVPCPISFTNEDVELHSKEEENINAVLPVHGMVEPKDYDTALKNSRKFKDIFIGLAKDDEEKELFTKLWPYQEPADTE